MNSSVSLILSMMFLFSSITLAHSEHEHEEGTVEIYADLVDKVANLQIIDTVNENTISMQYRTPTRFFFWGGKKVAIDNAFWDLADQISKLYIKELKNNCPDCSIPDIASIRREAENLVVQGWFAKKAIGLKDAVVYRYVGEFTGLGARYGVASGMAKVIGELMEDALLVIFKMPGAHFLCEAITFVIAYYSGTVLSYTRAGIYAQQFAESRWVMPIRLAVTSYYVRKTLKKIDITAPEFSIVDADLREFIDDNPEQGSWWRRKGLIGLNNDHRIERFLKLLQAKAEVAHRNNDNRALQSLMVLKEKVFQAKRMKRFLFLKKRNAATSLSRFTPHTQELFADTPFWFFEVKNEVFEPLTEVQGQREVSRLKQRALSSPANSPEAIMTVQLAQWEDSHGKDWARFIFETMDKIGDPNGERTERYFNFKFLEAFWTTVMPRMMHEISEHSIEDLPKEERSFLSVFLVQWRFNRFLYYTDQFVDFMRFSSLTSKTFDVTHKYHLRDYMSLILDSYSKLGPALHMENREDLNHANETLKEVNKELNASRLWIQKNKHPSLWSDFFQRNLGWGAPQCVELY